MGLNPRSTSEGWREVKISDVATVIRGASPRPKGDPRFYGGPIPRLMVEDVTRDGKVVYPSVDSLTVEGAKRSRPCTAGTLTLVCSGTVGVPSFLGVDACIHDGFIGLVNINADFSSDFIFHQLLRLRAEFDASATHGGVFTNLTTKGVGAFSFHAPESLHEQQAIAAALSDADGVVAGLKRVIAKKRLIKQGTMQDLLTARRRLPGFSGEWEVKRLGELCRLEMGGTPSRRNARFWGKGHPWVTIADLQSKVITQSKEQVTEEGAALLTPVAAGTLIMSFKLSIGRLAFAGVDLFTNEAICSFNDLAADADFLFYALSMTDFALYGKQAVKGYTLNKQSLKIVEVSIPEIAEQQAIATVLSDMDAEIQTLEARLTKARAVKEGMMQNLLTGRVRLV